MEDGDVVREVAGRRGKFVARKRNYEVEEREEFVKLRDLE